MLIYGWVSEQIQSNWANWSNWKEIGNQQDADLFWKNTVEEATNQGLTWFCYECE